VPLTRRQVFERITSLETSKCPFVNLPEKDAGRTEGDRKRLLLKQAFESIVRMANRYANELTGTAKEAETETGEVHA
jgi:hypothetical protein